jgi:hypothetical protein
VIYDKGFLKRLLQNTPILTMADLTDMYTLQFEDGNITVPKAKLRLCGEYFEIEFDSGMAENTNKTFQFLKITREVSEEILNSPVSHKVTTHILPATVSKKVFSEIMGVIETGKSDFSEYSEDFKVAAEYLKFYTEIDFPEGIIGKEELEKYLGNVGEVPPLYS